MTTQAKGKPSRKKPSKPKEELPIEAWPGYDDFEYEMRDYD